MPIVLFFICVMLQFLKVFKNEKVEQAVRMFHIMGGKSGIWELWELEDVKASVGRGGDTQDKCGRSGSELEEV